MQQSIAEYQRLPWLQIRVHSGKVSFVNIDHWLDEAVTQLAMIRPALLAVTSSRAIAFPLSSAHTGTMKLGQWHGARSRIV